MSFGQHRKQAHAVELLQRSLERARLAHGYLFVGHEIEELEAVARTLAKTLNCENPVKRNGLAVDSCDQCLSCRKIEHETHGDVHWLRPESKSRVILVEQVRRVMQEIYLKPGEGNCKVAIICFADRLNKEAANAFLKTLEEPPPKSTLILLTPEPQRLLDTILSRCLRLNFAGEALDELKPAEKEWLMQFSELAAEEQKSLLGRYRLADVLVQRLTELKDHVTEELTARSPLQRYKEAEKELVERWEDELKAAIEGEYRRRRAGLVALVQWWFRDVWLWTLGQKVTELQAGERNMLSFPTLTQVAAVGRRLTSGQAAENLEILDQLQRRLHTNVQETLAIEVSFLRLHL